VELYGEPLIIRLTERVRQAKIPADVIWCTSTHSQDDPLEQLASERSITCFRGSELDVMSRFIQVAVQEKASTVVRVTGDNPLTDPLVMDEMIEAHFENETEYTFTEDLPVGTRSEIIDVKMLKRCHKLLQDPDSSEYMTWMLKRPDHFKTLQFLVPDQKLKRPEISLTVDTENDLSLMQKIYEQYFGKPPVLEEIITWLDRNPELLLTSLQSTANNNQNINCRLADDS
jgi:spore coat polysaccharide biosynthesis protein SpsF (cytidylyltransferase family)